MLASDAHQAANLDFGFEEVIFKLQSIGFTSVQCMHKGVFEAVSI
jgi:hypothetical protein